MLGQTGALEEGDGFGAADFAIAVQIGATEIRIEEIHIRRLVLRRSHFFCCRRRRRRNSKQPPRVCVWRIDQSEHWNQNKGSDRNRARVHEKKIVMVRSTGNDQKNMVSIFRFVNEMNFIYFWVCDSMKEKTDGDSEREIEIEKKK